MNISPQFEMNEVTNKLPKHLHKYISKQEYHNYTGQDHAVWRYVMRKNLNYITKIAHSSYIEGLKKSGITLNEIPEIEGFNRVLKEIGWAAVAVDGFIPPNIFMKFHAYNVLPIVTKIRSIEHLDYSPTWDIIHEVMAYIPILVNPEYAEYMRRFGEIGSRAISNPKDYQLFEAMCEYSYIEQNPNSNKLELKEAENNIDKILKEINETSELAKICNLYWWSTEYGLVGNKEDFRVYGAKLLSYIEENEHYLSDEIPKELYSVKSANINFDITKTQQQLFIVPDLAYLSSVLEEFTNNLSLRKGGIKGLKKLIKSKSLGTIELSSGLQISGIFNNVIEDNEGNPIYIQTSGKTALAYQNKELIGHGIENHPNGFGCPIGKLHGVKLAIEEMNSYDLESFEIYEGKLIQLDFEGGIQVEGTITKGRRDLKGKVLLISFKDAVVTYYDEILFQPDEANKGVYHMALGIDIVSAYAGAADGNSFIDIDTTQHHHNNGIEVLSDDEFALSNLYNKTRAMRASNNITDKGVSEIFEELYKNHPNDWLLSLELYEVSKDKNFSVFPFLENHIEKIRENKKYAKFFDNGKLFLNRNLEDYGDSWVYGNFEN